MKRIVYSIPILLICLSCDHGRFYYAEVYINQVEAFYAQDHRTTWFQVWAKGSDPMVLEGETNLKLAKDSLISLLKYHQISFIDSIRVLPVDDEEKPFALINVSVANLRKVSSHSGELTTQALLGTPVIVLKEEGGWCLVQTPDRYISWTNEESLQRCSRAEMERWKTATKIIYTQTTGFTEDTLQQFRVSDLVAGNILELISETVNHWIVRYPDGRTAFVRKEEAEEWQAWLNNNDPAESSFTEKAMEFQGIPYLWGGTSVKGMDCSGFTKTVYMMQGIILPRDASQQVYVGEQIDSVGDFSKLKIGDLLFFGSKKEDGSERVVHVGLWLGNMQFIHASGDVHVSSMDSTSGLFDEFNKNRYIRSKRISEKGVMAMENLFDWL